MNETSAQRTFQEKASAVEETLPAIPPKLGALLPLLLLIAFVVVLFARFATRGDMYLSYFEDDYFYYLVVAKNMVLHGMSSFDGIRPTNGYQPLWELINYGALLDLWRPPDVLCCPPAARLRVRAWNLSHTATDPAEPIAAFQPYPGSVSSPYGAVGKAYRPKGFALTVRTRPIAQFEIDFGFNSSGIGVSRRHHDELSIRIAFDAQQIVLCTEPLHLVA